MSETTPQDSVATEQHAGPEPAIAPAAAPALSTWGWLREGVRAGFFLAPRVSGQSPAPAQIALIAALVLLLDLGLGRLEIDGPALFNPQAWVGPWWSNSLMVLASWWAISSAWAAAQSPGRGTLAGWWALWLPALIPVTLVSEALAIASARNALPSALAMPWLAWGLYVLLWVWTLGAELRLAQRFVPSRRRLGPFAAVLIAVSLVNAWQFQARPWYVDYSQAEGSRGPRFQPSQEVFEDQQRLWRETVAQIAPRRPGVANVYGLVFAPYASEDVFLRESTLVAQVLADRFDAKGRVLQLVNHASTARSHPWATPLNLERAIDALSQQMDRDQDVLVIYLTSHGAKDFKLSAYHWPLAVEQLTPADLRKALDNAGIRNRVVAISACYAGGWAGPLASDTTLVMTAADAENTSYGCGRHSELTFFGRALFDEQLRKTHSFEEAFAAAVPVIRDRETQAGKPDGFSNPQISMGEAIRPVLKGLQERLDAASAPAR